MSRKILSLIVAVAFVLTTMGTAFAATVPSDVTADFTKAVSKVQSLNVMVGYPDGTFKQDQTITRAEFAVIAVKSMGLNDSATISKGTTKFSDVAADFWGSGYINVAVGAGLINGYPDGTYAPDKTINYAEAITILSNMLGYGPVLAGKPWPGSYVAKANEVGVTTGVVMAPTVGASRGNVAKLVSNTLDSKIIYVSSYDKDGKPTYSIGSTAADTLMAKKLNVTELAAADGDKVFIVTNTPKMQAGATSSNATLADDNNGGAPVDYDGFIAGLNPDDYLGLKIKAWKNSDKKIVIAEVQTAASDIYNGVVSKDGSKIKLVGLSKSVDTAAPFFGYVNASAAASLAGLVGVLGNDKANATVVLADGKAKYVYAWADADVATASNSFIVKEIKDGYIKAINTKVPDIKIQDKKDKVGTKDLWLDIIKNGAVATIDDVKAGDIVTKIVNGSHERWLVTSNTATGTLTAVNGVGADMTLTIGANAYTLEAAHKFSFNNGDDYDKTYSNVKDIVGKEVTISLNTVGQIASLKSTVSSKTYYYGIAKSSASGVGTSGSDRNLILYKPDGTKVTYLLEDPDNIINKAAASALNTTKGQLVQYQLTSDSKIKNDSLVYGNSIQTDLNYGSDTASAIADDTMTIAGTVYSVLSSSVIFDVYKVVNDTGDVKIIPYSAIKTKTAAAYKILKTGVVAKYVSAYLGTGTGDNESGFSSSTSGVVLAKGYDADGQTVTVNENGAVKTYKLNTDIAANFIEKQYANYNVNTSGKISSVNSVGSYVYTGVDTTPGVTVLGAVYRVQSLDAASKVVKVKALYYDSTISDYVEIGSDLYFRYNSDTNIYDASDDSAVLTTIKGAQAASILEAGNYVWFDKEDQAITLTAIVKLKKDNLKSVQ